MSFKEVSVFNTRSNAFNRSHGHTYVTICSNKANSSYEVNLIMISYEISCAY